jgi:RNA polymerase sigma-70 factor, ECF subfamily
MERTQLYLLRSRDESLSAHVRRDAFGHVIEAHQDAAFAVAFSILGDATAAQDAAVEGFLEAWRNLDALREPAAFAVWLRALVRSSALRQVRNVRPHTALSEAAEMASAGRSPADHDRWLVVSEALSRLPESEREAVILFYVAGLTREETASFMGTSLVSAKKRLARALARLRKETIEMAFEELGNTLPSRNEDFRRQTLLLAGNFAALLASGRPILLALDDCIAQAGDGVIGAVFREMRAQVTKGELMAEVMRKHPALFDALDADAVQTGEELGRLDDVLRRLADGERFDSLDGLRCEYEAAGISGPRRI